MVKFSASFVAAILLGAPALSIRARAERRSLEANDIYGRDLDLNEDVSLLARRDLEEIFGRELVESLDERALPSIFAQIHNFYRFQHEPSLLRQIQAKSNPNSVPHLFGREFANYLEGRGPAGADFLAERDLRRYGYYDEFD